MKILLAIGCLIGSLSLQAQTESPQKGTWVLGGIFSPQYAYRTLKSDDSQTWQANALDTLETPRYGYSVGILGGRSLGKKAVLEFSLLFADKGQRIKQLGTWRNYTDHNYYLDLPLAFRYNFVNKSIKVFVSAGVNTSVALYSRTTYIDPAMTKKQEFRQESQLSPVHFGLIAGAGLTSPISEHIDFRLMIAYRRALTPTSDTPLTRQFWSLGADLGFTYRF